MKLDIILGMAWLGSGSMGPICQPQSLDPLDGTNIAFINLKLPLILHIAASQILPSTPHAHHCTAGQKAPYRPMSELASIVQLLRHSSI